MTAYYEEFYICERGHECDARADCKHSKAHFPDELDDDCLIDPCPYLFLDDQSKEIYCIPLLRKELIMKFNDEDFLL
jgi:hypothetical protein